MVKLKEECEENEFVTYATPGLLQERLTDGDDDQLHILR